jgi:hypothetical protein
MKSSNEKFYLKKHLYSLTWSGFDINFPWKGSHWLYFAYKRQPTIVQRQSIIIHIRKLIQATLKWMQEKFDHLVFY